MFKMLKYILIYLIFIVSGFYLYNNYIQVQPSSYQNTYPIFDFKTFFNGEFQGVGISQDWRGKVNNIFEITIIGSWDGEKGQIVQDIKHNNNEEGIERIWKIKQIDEHHYQGKEDNILGIAKIEQYGNMLSMKYKKSYNFFGIDIETDINNRMYLINDSKVLSKILISKLGIPISSRTTVYQK